MTSHAATTVRDCDLCIIGGGYAALNALNAAAKYLKKGARVVVVDKRAGWGGQWRDQYDFVRLHQPYQLFTAGDQRWRLQAREATYLATRREVLDHLGTVPRRSAGHLEVEPLFGHEYTGHRLDSGRLEVDVRPVGGGTPTRFRAKRLLNGTGADIAMLPPFSLSTRRVRSVAISDPVLTSPEFLESDAPVYIIGSGKTAMDCVGWLAAMGTSRRRKVAVILGSGMYFFVREELFPRGASRYTGGVLTTDVFLKISELFDGTNEDVVMSHLAGAGIVDDVFGEAGNCRYAVLSKTEREVARARVDEVIRGHLVDVEGTHMVVRERGTERAVEVPEASWFINCTTHMLPRPHEPLLRDDGLVCAPQNVFGFTGTSAYFITHLWFRDELSPVAERLFRVAVDVEPKLRLAPQFALAMIANISLIRTRLPVSVFRSFEGDFNKWYPIHRQLPVLLRLMARGNAAIAKAERVLPLRFTDPVAPSSTALGREAAVA